jgi:hypothetical protein
MCWCPICLLCHHKTHKHVDLYSNLIEKKIHMQNFWFGSFSEFFNINALTIFQKSGRIKNILTYITIIHVLMHWIDVWQYES